MSPTPEPAQDEKVHTFNVSLTIYTLLKKTTTRGARKVATVKEEKSVKVKELPFAINEDNYIDFLTSLLEKHGQEQHKVSEKCCFPFNQRSGDGMDVDNESDYKEMVQKIREHDVSNTKIFVDMKDVEKLPTLIVNGMVDDEDNESGPIVEASASSNISDMDMHLMRWCLMLQTHYKNEFGNGYTYVSPTGPVTLTPGLLMDWCHALDEGHATLSTPPNIESFNLVMKGTPLHPSRKAQSSQPAPLNGVDVNSLTLVLLLQALTNLSSGLIQPIAAVAAQPSIIASNKSPTVQHLPPPREPAIPALPLSPSEHLKQFLAYAETYFSVEDSAWYEEPLRLENIRPDILADVDEKTLGRIGISIGDIACLKRCSIAWWNGQEAKHKRSGTGSTTLDTEPTNSRTQIASPPQKKNMQVAYKKHFHDGGGCHFTGPMMEAGDADPTADYELYYKCDTQNQWLPVPRGFIVIEDGEDSEKEDNMYPF